MQQTLVVEEEMETIGETATKSAEIGVLSQIQKPEKAGILRGERGKLLPGTAPLPGAGRARGPQPDIRKAIWERYTVEEILARLDKAYEIAVEQRSPRGVVAATQPLLEYGLGKPVQQVMVEAGRTELLEYLMAQPVTPLLEAHKEIETV